MERERERETERDKERRRRRRRRMRGGVRVHISCTHLGQRAIGQQIFRGTNSIALFDQWTSPQSSGKGSRLANKHAAETSTGRTQLLQEVQNILSSRSCWRRHKPAIRKRGWPWRDNGAMCQLVDGLWRSPQWMTWQRCSLECDCGLPGFPGRIPFKQVRRHRWRKFFRFGCFARVSKLSINKTSIACSVAGDNERRKWRRERHGRPTLTQSHKFIGQLVEVCCNSNASSSQTIFFSCFWGVMDADGQHTSVPDTPAGSALCVDAHPRGWKQLTSFADVRTKKKMMNGVYASFAGCWWLL